MDHPPKGYCIYWEYDDSHHATYHWASTTLKNWYDDNDIEYLEKPNPDQFYLSDWYGYSDWCYKMKNEKLISNK